MLRYLTTKFQGNGLKRLRFRQNCKFSIKIYENRFTVRVRYIN